MTDPKRIHDALDQIAGEAVPENTDLWQQIRARAASAQHSRPAIDAPQRSFQARPSFRPALGLAAAALAMLLCVMVGITWIFAPNLPTAPVIGLVPATTGTPDASPQGGPTGMAQAVGATMTAFQPEATRTLLAPLPTSGMPTATIEPTLPIILVTEPASIEPPTPHVPQVQPTDAPPVLPTPTQQPTPVRPQITGLSLNRVGQEQTLNGVTVRLDWAYLDEAHLFFQYSVIGLPQQEGLDLRGAARVTGVASSEATLDLTGNEPENQEISSAGDTLIVRETRELQHAVREGDLVDFAIDITAGGVTLPRAVTGADGTHTSVEGVELPPAGTFRFDIRIPYYPALRLEPNQTVSAGGVGMELSWLKISPSSTELGICFEAPTADNWQLDSATLQISGAAPVMMVEQGLDLSEPSANTLTSLRRCLHARFPTLYDGAPTTAALNIPALSTPVDMVNHFEEARRTLAAQGIEIERVAVNGGYEIRITRRPETVSEEEANSRLFDAARLTVSGPWNFTIAIPGRVPAR